MSNETTEYTGERVTFRELFDHGRHPVVEVPIVQRDYAQGRAAALEVRTEFLQALHTALSKPDEEAGPPLDLDFVYGSVENAQRKAFLPLDGQQRLTTLFLLHWYLAWKDGKSGDFAAFITTARKSRFSYAVRPSSEEFFNELVCYTPASRPKEVKSVSAVIIDQHWFFRSWKLDPTVQSALTMLDAIHERFVDSEGFYDRLVRSDKPRIAFQLLELRSFGLSDDLYIKMNARGKPLTPFETFKARLEQHLSTHFPNETIPDGSRNVALKDYFSHRIDTRWADLFWTYRDPRTHLYDEKIMHLFRALAIVTRNPEQRGIASTIIDLINPTVSFSFLKYQELGCLDLSLITSFIVVLDNLSGGPKGIRWHLPSSSLYQEKAIFEKAIKDSTKLSYPELVQFHAYCAYIVQHRDGFQRDAFSEWMRIIANLTENTNYDRLADFTRDIRTINELLSSSDRILHFLAEGDTTKLGFNEQQVREEKLKAQLCLKSAEWRTLILLAEQHGYFKGQVEFLLKFSGILDRWLKDKSIAWSNDEDAEYRRRFSEYFSKASAVFASHGLQDIKQYRWERALLTKGDYTLQKGRNWSFLDNSDRDASWKRLLRGSFKQDVDIEQKRGYLRELLDEIDLDLGVEKSLDAVLSRATPCEVWRQAMIEQPEIIGYCWGRMIRWHSEENIYLLRKSQMNGEHAELFTHHLWIGLLSEKHQRGELSPFGAPNYHSVKNESEQPCAFLDCRLSGNSIALNIYSSDGGYWLEVFNRYGPLPAKFKDALVDELGLEIQDSGRVGTGVSMGDIESAIDNLIACVRKLVTPGKAVS